MHFLFSGEGATDCGTCTFDDRICTGANFSEGPLVLLASQIVEGDGDYTAMVSHRYALVERPALNRIIADLKSRKKQLRLPRNQQSRETLHFERSAQALARWARKWAEDLGDDVVAIYFRDADTRNATPSGDWQAKHDAVRRGFQLEAFERGVPMIPQPTSEAWLICALKDRPYEHCEQLEARSGSPKAKQPLKQELESILGTTPTREVLCELVTSWRIDEAKINMPSFNAFRTRLLEVARSTEGC